MSIIMTSLATNRTTNCVSDEVIQWCREAFALDGETVVWARDTTRGIKAGDQVGIKWVKGYARVNVNLKPRKMILLHRLKWLLKHDYLPDTSKFVIDHKDRDTTNNDFSNLRIATKSQNRINAVNAKDELPKGVGITRQRGMFKAYIGIKGRTKHLGYFHDLTEAIEARNIGAKKYYGEYAPCHQ
jgi:hypothetical protein